VISADRVPARLVETGFLTGNLDSPAGHRPRTAAAGPNAMPAAILNYLGGAELAARIGFDG